MGKKIWLSMLVLLLAFCIGLSIIALVGAVVVVQSGSIAPVERTSPLVSSPLENPWLCWSGGFVPIPDSSGFAPLLHEGIDR